MNQLWKDEETKRRVSSSMKAQHPGAVPVKAAAPPSELIIKPQKSSEEPIVPFNNSNKSPPRTPPRPSMTQVEKDEETKRRVSSAMRTPQPYDKAGDEGMPMSDKKPSPVRTPPYDTNNYVSAPDKLVIPASTSGDRDSLQPVMFPKARLTPTRLSSLPPANAKAGLRISPRSPLIMPSLTPSPSPSSSLNRTDSTDSARRSSLPLIPLGLNTIQQQQQLMGGEKAKQRVSLPPFALSPLRNQQIHRSATEEPSNSSHRRVSLTEALAVKGSHSSSSASTTPNASPLPRHSVAAVSRSNTTTPSSTPTRQHRLGDKKGARISLPTAAAMQQAQSVHVAPVPPIAVTAESGISLPGAFGSTKGHKQLGEKKRERLSLPSSVAMAAAAAAASLVTEPEEQKEEEQEMPTSASVPTTDDAAPRTTADNLPKKGLRTNRNQASGMPVLAGPGAYFVPGEDVEIDLEQGTHEEIDYDIEVPAVNTGDDEEIHVSATFTTHENLSSAFSLGDGEDELAPPILPITTYRPPAPSSVGSSPRRSSAASSPRRISAAVLSDSHKEPEEESHKKKGWCRCNAPWWCNLVVPLVLAGIIIPVVIMFVKSTEEATDELQHPVPRETLAPSLAPALVIFENSTVPDFTVAAWNDTNSPQSKARDWLRDDPHAGGYSQERLLQRFALATLYHATNGARWKNSTNWLSYSHHECLWFSARPTADAAGAPVDVTGIARSIETNTSINPASLNPASINPTSINPDKAVTCNGDYEYEHLFLAADSLLGTLPPELSLLTSLVNIDLGSNKVLGAIPSELGLLTKLTDLALSENELESTIPTELGLLSELQRLYVRKNSITGSLPTQLAELTLLKDLHVTDNDIDSTIPTVLGLLTQLETLRLGSNQFVGPIPSEIGLCQNLNLLNFAQNQLTGTIPTEMGLLSVLNFFGIARNPLDTTLPMELLTLTNLQTLFASRAGLWGSIPTQGLSNLVALSIGENKFTGSLPTEIGLLTGLKFLYVNSNELTGPLPSEIGNLRQLSQLHAFTNPITSTIPSEIGILTDLTELLLFDTMLTGQIPHQIANLSQLTKLNIRGTSIIGYFPDATCSLQSAEQLTITADCARVGLHCC